MQKDYDFKSNYDITSKNFSFLFWSYGAIGRHSGLRSRPFIGYQFESD